MAMTPAIFGLSGATLTDDERDFFRDAKPAGFILFKRNCVDRAQLLALTDSLRELEGQSNIAILIDQEGGRVSRLQPPEWPAFPAGAVFDRLYDLAPISAMEAARCNGRALGLMLREVGVTVDCLPLLDVRTALTHAAIGDRALGADPPRVASLGRAILDGLREGGVVGVVKHMPGQGRATVDSHRDLPVVDANDEDLETDLKPFRQLRNAPIGMTGHVVFSAWDRDRPATMSPIVIGNIIRDRIGFDGLLMSDDLDMKALDGSIADRAFECVAAGCDIALNCWGRLDEMVAIASKLPVMTGAGVDRLTRAMDWATPVTGADALPELMAKRDELLALV